GSDRVGKWPAVAVDGTEGEAGQLVVGEEDRRPLPRAECRFGGGLHGQKLAALVDDGEMAGTRLLDGLVVAERAAADLGQLAGRGPQDGGPPGNQGAARIVV